jgi:hypothetical protein
LVGKALIWQQLCWEVKHEVEKYSIFLHYKTSFDENMGLSRYFGPQKRPGRSNIMQFLKFDLIFSFLVWTLDRYGLGKTLVEMEFFLCKNALGTYCFSLLQFSKTVK